MKKILEYCLSIYCVLNTLSCYAIDKFEILPDLPDPLAAYAQSAEAASVSGGDPAGVLTGVESVGHEPSILSVIFSLAIVILLIYITGIIYTKLNKVGFNTLKKQNSEFAKAQASVISTTSLGNNRSLHVVELDGKRMLIGASSGAIQLIKDLGNVSDDGEKEEFSSIEIPTIKIPKIEIPKIEIPSIGFSKLMTKIHKGMENESSSDSKEENTSEDTGYTDEHVKDDSDGIIDSLFTATNSISIENEETNESAETVSKHSVDPDDYALYKKYLS